MTTAIKLLTLLSHGFKFLNLWRLQLTVMYTGALNDDIPEILFDFIMPLNSLNPGSGKYFDF